MARTAAKTENSSATTAAGKPHVPEESIDTVLVNMQRLAGIGMLAAGIAQELASLLSVVTAASSSLRYELDGQNGGRAEAIQQYVNLIERNAHRSAQIATTLQNYGTVSAPQMAITDVDTILRDTLLLVGKQFQEEGNIHIEATLPEGSRSIVCDHNLVVQLLLNLLNNARDAMPESGGKVELTVSAVQAGEQVRLNGIELAVEPTYDRIAIVVTDNGLGIAPESGADPHETLMLGRTNAASTGLALHIAHDIVRQHHGDIWASKRNGPDEGATITVLLPLGQLS